MASMHILRRGRTFGLVAASALVLSGCNSTPYSLPLPGGADLGDHPYTVKAEFRDAMDLVPQGGVRSSDVTVGKITDVQLKRGSWTALVSSRPKTIGSSSAACFRRWLMYSCVSSASSGRMW